MNLLLQHPSEWDEFKSTSDVPVCTEAPAAKTPYQQREDSDWTDISKKWLDIHLQIKTLEREEKTLREVLIQMAGVENVTGGGVRITRSMRKGSIQYGQIPELQNIDLEKYRKEPTEVWTLLPSVRKSY